MKISIVSEDFEHCFTTNTLITECTFNCRQLADFPPEGIYNDKKNKNLSTDFECEITLKEPDIHTEALLTLDCQTVCDPRPER